MPLDRFVLILVIVVAAAALTVWVATIAFAAMEIPGGWMAIIPAVLVGYVVWRVIADRLSSAEDDHYDRIEK